MEMLADPNLLDDTIMRELYDASLKGCVSTLKTLIQRDPLILSRVSLYPFSQTPLHIASLLGHLEFCQVLLDTNPSLAGEVDSEGRCPLHLASAKGHTEIVKALLLKNPEIYMSRDKHDKLPLHFAAMRGRVGAIKELMNARPDSIREMIETDDGSILHLCVLYNHLEALKIIVESMRGNHQFLSTRYKEDDTVLHLAVRRRQIKVIKYLLSLSGMSTTINTLNRAGLTPLDVLEHCPRDLITLTIEHILTEEGAQRSANTIIAQELVPLTPRLTGPQPTHPSPSSELSQPSSPQPSSSNVSQSNGSEPSQPSSSNVSQSNGSEHSQPSSPQPTSSNVSQSNGSEPSQPSSSNVSQSNGSEHSQPSSPQPTSSNVSQSNGSEPSQPSSSNVSQSNGSEPFQPSSPQPSSSNVPIPPANPSQSNGSEPSQSSSPQPSSSAWKRFENFCTNQDNWVEQRTREQWMVAATVMATMTFQSALSPPGGVWQADTHDGSFTCNQYDYCEAGTAVVGYVWSSDFLKFIFFNSTSFFASLCVVLVLISGFPLKNTVIMYILAILMLVAITCMLLTYMWALGLVSPNHIYNGTRDLGYILVGIWSFLLFVVGLIQTTRVVFWFRSRGRRSSTTNASVTQNSSGG